MKSLIYTGPETLEFGDTPDPVPGPGELLLDIAHVGICGSDMHAFHGKDERRPAPLILGHEAAGVSADGRRFAVNPLVSCGECPACLVGDDNLCAGRQIISMPPRAGAFAQKLAMPEENLLQLPEGLSTEKASLTEPIACGWHAVRLATRALRRPIDDAACLVLGGGAIGLGVALVLRAHGARSIAIAETNPARRAVLGHAGDFEIIDPVAGHGPKAVDLVVDAVGIEATRAAASAAVRPGGVIMHIGLGAPSGGLDIRRMTLQEITFTGTYTYSKVDFAATLAAIADGRLGALDWYEVRPLREGARAFRDILAGAAAPKIILEP